MAVEILVRPLVKSDDRNSFSCGEPALDRFFRDYAGQNQFKLNVAVTYVAITDQRIWGFATVASGSVERAQVPTQKLRRRLPAYPLPIVRLARLGVATEAQGHGVGALLLRHVLHLAVEQRDTVGCVGVVTDAKPAAVAFYQQYGFLALQGVREGALHGEPTPMFLPMATVVQATS